MSSIYPEIQNKFLELREQYISDYKDALKSHRGMGRLKLTPQEQLNFDRRKADMQNYVAWGKGATASLDKVNQDVIAALKAGEIEPGAYEKWFNGYMDEITKSKNGGDVPNAYSHFINANLIHPKVKSENEDKIVEFLEKGQTGIYQNEKGEKVEGHDDEKLLRQINNYSATKDLSEKEKERYFNLAKGQYKSPDKPEKEMTAYEKASLGIRYKELSDKEKEKDTSVKEIDPVSDADGKHWYTTDTPTKWSGQVDVPIAPDDPKKGTKKVSASGEGTELLQKPDGSLVHIVNVKYRNTPNGKEREAVKEVPVTSSYFAKINKDKKYKFNGLDENSIGGNNAPQGKSWADPSGNTHTLDDIKSGWKKKYGKDITDDQLTKVLSSLKAK
jgi:hypothetical protein